VVSLLRRGGGLFAPVLGGHFDRFFHKTKSNTLKIAEKSVHRDSILFRSSTIAEIDIDRSSIDYFGILESSQVMEKDNTSIGIQIEDTKYKLQALLLEQKETESKLEMDLISSYNELFAGIRKWKLTYCFVSPIKGTLEYLNFWRENDFITVGTGVFSVLPSDNPILGQVYLPSQGAGKVVVGQDVIIKLDNYPFLEFGSISGKVKTISRLSSQTSEFAGQNKINAYLITIELPAELTTNYGAKLDFRYEITGIADVLISKRKLLERLFDNLKYIVSKK
jgi:multidrug resistance efflux pump